MDVIEEAKARTDHMVNKKLIYLYVNFSYMIFNTIFYNLQITEKKKKLKKEGKIGEGSAVPILEEETEEGYRHAIWVMTMKLFADMERRRFV